MPNFIDFLIRCKLPQLQFIFLKPRQRNLPNPKFPFHLEMRINKPFKTLVISKYESFINEVVPVNVTGILAEFC